MCGLAGALLRNRLRDGDALVRDVGAMAAAIVHRGPDEGGAWTDAAFGVALAHRRLSILDLSAAGRQPMHSASGRFVIAFNGEIYNHLELRNELPGFAWRGHSDTETLLAAFETWGVEAALRRMVGMFAIALWDSGRKELTLARDRLGEKPLYYGLQDGVLLFGSELKALAAYRGWAPQVDRDALALFMRYGYVPLPHTIWRGIRKLLPGSYLTFAADVPITVLPAPTLYWRAAEVAAGSARTSIDEVGAVGALDQHLRAAVAGQMVADVPLGAFLSGGVDSSTIVALMQAQSPRPVRTFSIGFTEADYNEAAYAKAVAAHLGTDHTEFYVSPEDAQAVIPRLAEMYDEPFGDSSQIPTHLVAAMARRHVTVCLSGDGGDELFGGYNRYFWGRSIWRRIGPLPRGLRAAAGRAVSAVSPQAWDRIGRALPSRLRQPTLGDRLHKLAGVIDVASTDELYRRLVSQHREPRSIVIGGDEAPIWADAEAADFARSARGGDFTERMMFHDLVGYLSDDILAKVDRAAMAVSLETRIPLLDHRLVEFAWSLPLDMKIRHGQGKWLLRQVLYRYVPKELIERPKQGFGIPLDSWLRGPLRDWAEALLDESRLRHEGFLHPEPVRRKWAEHLSGRRNWQYWLWNVLMFQAWRERWA
ncbi:MAG: asparagine synthase (glutamine-hydrolyzing) [Sulfuritalea sp.]|nr:asparagine synthase (glutamine-hydrolyzing) [Sulfuritalea sp.]MDP1985167.1 asparagine synthase (glutamine-hydrolyzing) [Sulfuritalea sp.]